MSDRLVTVLPLPRPRVVSVGTALPATRYPQDRIADLLGIRSGLGRRFFDGSGIAARHFYFEQPVGDEIPSETQPELLARHRRGALALGREAIAACLLQGGLQPAHIDFLCCVTSTGLTMPGLSAMYVRHLGFRHDCQRADIVGMGCNAALSALNVVTGWSAANPGRYAMVVCCEINSAIHVRDERPVTAVVNSLFGDGCGALLVCSGESVERGPEVLGMSSQLVPDAWRAISYHWSSCHNKFELYLDREIPNVLGTHSPTPISALLAAFGLTRSDISHWLVHAGGKKVIQAVGAANGLSDVDLRYSSAVLHDVGNIGSATIMFSYERLLTQGCLAAGQYGVVVTMGPGATIETALLRW